MNNQHSDDLYSADFSIEDSDITPSNYSKQKEFQRKRHLRERIELRAITKELGLSDHDFSTLFDSSPNNCH